MYSFEYGLLCDRPSTSFTAACVIETATGKTDIGESVKHDRVGCDPVKYNLVSRGLRRSVLPIETTKRAANSSLIAIGVSADPEARRRGSSRRKDPVSCPG